MKKRRGQCGGPRGHIKHIPECRPGRPLCRWRRRLKGICHCHAYHFPHRDGSGRCGDDEAYLEYLMTPRRRTA